jgi:putative heme-binding domain-containing protein
VEKTVKLMQVTKAKVPDFDAEVMKRNKGYGGSILNSMQSAPNILNIHFLFCLKDVQTGWTMDARKAYLGELKTLLSKKGGNMFTGYINKIRESAIASVPEKDRVALQYLMGAVKTIDLSKLPKAKGPPVAWTVESGLKVLQEEPLAGRNLANGKKMFSAGMCVACHRFGTEGGGIGPDLTNLAKRSDYKSMLESILEPNLVVSDQFQAHVLTMKDGSTVTGRIISDQNGELDLVQSGFEPTKLTNVKKANIESMKASTASMMPPGLINTMNAEEVKDLIAYFVSQGNSRHPVYKKPRKDMAKLNIKLISAIYGVANDAKKQVDVTKILQRRLDSFDYDFTITNDVAGKDPAPGIVKNLVIRYSIQGKTVTKTVGENNTIPWQ